MFLDYRNMGEQQLSFDRMHENANGIYQVNARVSDQTGTYNQAITPAPLAAALVSDLPEIDRALRIDVSGAVVNSANQQFVEEGVIATDPSFFDFFDFRLLKGNPATALSDSSRGFIINEAAARAYGYNDSKEAIGKFFRLGRREGEVIGVVHDFHYATLHENIEPMALFLLRGYFSRITVRMNGNAARSTTLITNTWKKLFPESVVDFSFVEDRLHQGYRSENRFSEIFFIFSIISITMASLGLFALVSYNVERRSREIGIRKVFGGTVVGISAMLSKEFLLLVLIS